VKIAASGQNCLLIFMKHNPKSGNQKTTNFARGGRPLSPLANLRLWPNKLKKRVKIISMILTVLDR
jgi:hypothetical protein